MKQETVFYPDRAVKTLFVSFVTAPIEFDMGDTELQTAETPEGQHVGGLVCTRPGEQDVYTAVLRDGCEGQHAPECERCETARLARAWLTIGRVRCFGPAGPAPAVPHFLRLEPLTE